jgi:hypothetical protein
MKNSKNATSKSSIDENSIKSKKPKKNSKLSGNDLQISFDNQSILSTSSVTKKRDLEIVKDKT